MAHDVADVRPRVDVEGVFAGLGGEDGECAGRGRGYRVGVYWGRVEVGRTSSAWCLVAVVYFFFGRAGVSDGLDMEAVGSRR